MRQALILAGGLGTRLKDRLGELPKPMIPIGGRPLLEHQVELCRQHGLTELVLFVHHRAGQIQDYFADGSRWGVKIRYVLEQEPLGTAGAILAGWETLAESFVVLYGDTMVNVELARLHQHHVRSGAAATLLLHPNNHPLDSDLVEVDAQWRVTAFHPRPHPAGACFQNLVNAGLYVLEKRALASWRNWRDRNPASEAETGGEAAAGGFRTLDFGRDVFPGLLREGVPLHGYNTPEYIKDIGTPARYDRVCAEYANGTVARSVLSAPQRAVFLDRDGTLIAERDGLRTAAELELLPGVAEAIALLNSHGWRAVVVTNQPVLAKGWCSEAELQRIHNRLEMDLGKEHAFLDRIYYCPHHPDKGFPGERPELKVVCECRKPKTGMIRQAVADLNIELGRSWLIGDTTTDLQTARNAGLRSILVRTGAGGRDGRHTVAPDYTCADLREAVRFLTELEPAGRWGNS